MAITSLVLGVGSFFCWIFTGLPAIILGALSLRKIYRSNGQLKGEGLAIGGIVCGGITTVFIAPIMIALLLPAVQAAREAARRNQSMNNLKQISLGMLNYADSKGTLPAPGGGNSQLSWRVHILPDHRTASAVREIPSRRAVGQRAQPGTVGANAGHL